MKKKLFLISILVLGGSQLYSMERETKKSFLAEKTQLFYPRARHFFMSQLIDHGYSSHASEQQMQTAMSQVLPALKNKFALSNELFFGLMLSFLLNPELFTNPEKFALTNALLQTMQEITPQQKDILSFFKEVLEGSSPDSTPLSSENLARYWDQAVAYPTVVEFFLAQGANPAKQTAMSLSDPRKLVTPLVRALEEDFTTSAQLLLNNMQPKDVYTSINWIMRMKPEFANKIFSNGETILDMIPNTPEYDQLKSKLARIRHAQTTAEIKGKEPL